MFVVQDGQCSFVCVVPDLFHGCQVNAFLLVNVCKPIAYLFKDKGQYLRGVGQVAGLYEPPGTFCPEFNVGRDDEDVIESLRSEEGGIDFLLYRSQEARVRRLERHVGIDIGLNPFAQASLFRLSPDALPDVDLSLIHI